MPFRCLVNLGLVMTLILGLAMSTASAYPAGATISHGTNPVVSAAGRVSVDAAATDLFVVPAGQTLIVTDVTASASTTDSTCAILLRFTLQRSDGTIVGEYNLGLDTAGYTWLLPDDVDVNYVSGLTVPAEETLQVLAASQVVKASCSTIEVSYTISGYYAQP